MRLLFIAGFNGLKLRLSLSGSLAERYGELGQVL